MMQVTANNTRTEDAELVRMARSGNSSAFDTLVKRFQRPVYAVAFAVLSDREAAQDVLQDSMIAAYRQLGSLDNASKFGSWVCAIAAKQARRSYGRRVLLYSRQVDHPAPEKLSPDPVEDSGLAQRIREALGTLTEIQAQAVTLFYMEGYSVAECARMLDVPDGTIKRRLHDARQRLKKEMIDMIRKQLPQYALPEDYRVVIEKPTAIHSTRPALTYFRDRWVLLWQDGVSWEPYDGPFWFWVSESADGKDWSEPRKLDLPKSSDEMRYHPDYLGLMNCCVVGEKLVFLTQQFSGHVDLYSSEDTVDWTPHPRMRMGMTSRSSLFAAGGNLWLVYPSLLTSFGCGNRVDMIRSGDGGLSWSWGHAPYWGEGEIFDAAGVEINGRIYVIWREILSKWVPTGEVSGVVHWRKHVGSVQDPDVPDGAVTQRVHLNWSDDGGQTWARKVWHPQEFPDNSGLTIYPLPEKPEPVVVEMLDVVKPYTSNNLRTCAYGDTLAIAQAVHTDYAGSEVWVAFSRDGGLTWPEKAVYKPGTLLDTDVAFTPDGALLLAGSSRTGSESRPWVVHSRIRP